MTLEAKFPTKPLKAEERRMEAKQDTVLQNKLPEVWKPCVLTFHSAFSEGFLQEKASS